MSTGEHSAEDVAKAELTARALPDAILEKVRAAAAWNKPPAPVAQPSGAEEAAIAFIHDAPAAAPAPALKLVEGDADPVERAQLKAAKHGEVLRLDREIAALPAGDAKEALKELRDKVNDAKSTSEIRNLMAAVGSAKADAIAKVETPQDKADRLWDEMQKADKETKEKSDKLAHLKTEEERTAEKEAEEKREKAKAEYERLKNDPNATAEQREAALKAYFDSRRTYDTVVKTTFTRIANDPSTPEQDRKTAEEGIASVERGEAARELARNADAAGKAMSATNIQSMDSMKARMDGPKIMGTEDLTSLIISNEPSAANPTVKLATAEANPSNLGALNLAVSSLALTKPDASVERS